ncbi:hypothetical protein GGI42DRAFT_318259 [Trichoderma sp. SZMC 28013]
MSGFFLVVVTLPSGGTTRIGFSRAERLRRDGEDNNGHSLPPSADILQVANDCFYFFFFTITGNAYTQPVCAYLRICLAWEKANAATSTVVTGRNKDEGGGFVQRRELPGNRRKKKY